MAMAMAVAICRATWNGWKKLTGAKVMATSVAKNTSKYIAGVKTRAANSMAKFGLRAEALGNSRVNERANWHCGQNQ